MALRKHFLRLLLLAGFGLMAAACHPAALLNATVPDTGYGLQEGIAYGEDARQKLDIYVPGTMAGPAPVIVFFYGGSWQSGSRKDYRFVGQALASQGFVAVVADYRLYPQVYFPAFVEDGAKAFAWVHEHIATYGGDPERLFLAGHSAGAYIAVMLTVNDSYLKAAGAQRDWIKGTIGIAGPYDFLPLTDPKLIELFSKAEPAATQPITFATSPAPPMLLATGDADTEVLPKNTYNLVERLKSLDSPVEERVYPGVAHIGIILALSTPFRSKAPLLDDIARFVNGVK